MELRDKVARAIYLAYAQHPEADWRAVEQRMKGSVWLPQADAAIATVQEAEADTITTLRAEVATLREHISEQIEHVKARIKDGTEMGATVWRIALEDVATENARALLETNHAK